MQCRCENHDRHKKITDIRTGDLALSAVADPGNRVFLASEVSMELAKYKACICEGSAENAIMDILLDQGLLIFNREEMLDHL